MTYVEEQRSTSDDKRQQILELARLTALEVLPSRGAVDALGEILAAARELTGAQFAALGVVRTQGIDFDQLITDGVITDGESSREAPSFGVVTDVTGADAAGILRLLLEREEPLRVRASPVAGGESFLGAALRRGSTPLGAIYLTNKLGGLPFTQENESDLVALGAHATVAIHHLHALERERMLVAGLMAAHEEERRTIAYDLHDGLCQYVMAAHIHLEAFQYAQKTGKVSKSFRELALTARHLQTAVTESRRLISGLRLLALDDLGLAGALEILLLEEEARSGWGFSEFSCNFGTRRFERQLETAVYRIAQEALTNVRKHAAAPWVKLRCEIEDTLVPLGKQLRLVVSDGGLGFEAPDQELPGPNLEGVGFYSMAERARLLQASFSLHSIPGEGTTVTAVFPLVGHREADP